MWIGVSSSEPVGVSILAACLYGLIHDQVTVRIFPPYFQHYHPDLHLPVIQGLDPITELALAWGIVATWWMGAFLGWIFAVAGYAGDRQPAPWSKMLKAICFVMAGSGVSALAVGIVTWFVTAGQAGRKIFIDGEMVDAPEGQRWTTVLFVHNTSYDMAVLLAVGAAIWLYVGRPRSDR